MSDIEIIQLRPYQLPGRGIKIHWPLLGARQRHQLKFVADHYETVNDKRPVVPATAPGALRLTVV